MTPSAVAWALRRALRLAIATAVVALLFATVFSGEGAERVATTAYLAAIFAAVVLAIQRFLPAPAQDRDAPPEQTFPAFLAFLFGVGVLLGISGALASLPGAEALTLVAGFALVAVVAFARSGSVAALNAALVRGGPVAAATRYAVVAAVATCALAALLPSDIAGDAANVAYRLMIVATVALAASLVASTPAGAFVARCYAQTGRLLDRLAVLFRTERAARYAAAAGVAALISASLLAGKSAEPFAIAAYAAAAAATFIVAVECRRLRD